MWKTRILVGFDGNPSVAAATEIATTLAKATGVPVTLATVVKEGSPSAQVMAALAQDAADAMRIDGVEAEVRIVTGTPADALLALAREIQADLVILGKRHGGLYRLLPNSPTDRLVGAGEWPVLIAKAGRMDSLRGGSGQA